MFQYTREIIINDQTVTALKEGNKSVGFSIDHVGTFKQPELSEPLIVAPTTAAYASVAVPTTTTTADVTRYNIKITMQSGEVDPILANFSTRFNRDIVVEVAKGSAKAAILAAFEKAFKGLEEWPVYLKVVSSTGTIYARSPYVSLQIVTEELTYREGSISEMTVTKTTEGTISKGTRPFGTYDTLVKNNRLPTAENLRPWGVNQEEYPIRGKEYTLYEYTLTADRNIGGFGVLGQKATSKVTLRFWVDDSKTAVKAIFAAVGTTSA